MDRSRADWEIREERSERFKEHGQIPISFEAKSRLDLNSLRHAGRLVEIPMHPRLKDYDANEEDRPSNLPARFDCSNWGLLAVFAGIKRIGGAIIARDCIDFDLLEGRADLAHIVDIRVAPSFRGKGIGRGLIEACKSLATREGCVELRVETQDTNVAACRFYVACGFGLLAINEAAYGPNAGESQLIWHLSL